MGHLIGKKEISKYLELSWPSIVKLNDRGLPVKKVDGQWFSHTELLNDYFKKMLVSTMSSEKMYKKR